MSSDPLATAVDAAERLYPLLNPELAESLRSVTEQWHSRAPMISILRQGLSGLLHQHALIVGNTPIPQLEPTSHQAFDAQLQFWREWCKTWQIEILPRNFCFSSSFDISDFDHVEMEKSIIYRPDVERGKVSRIRSFGIAVLGKVREKAQLTISAGTAPAELSELEALARQLPHDDSTRYLARFRSFRDASLAGNLESVAVQMLVDVMDHDRYRWDATIASEFSERLLILLHEEFGIQPIYPSSYHDHPDGWIRIPEGVWMQTGRITTILRPILIDREGRLRIPARVEVE